MALALAHAIKNQTEAAYRRGIVMQPCQLWIVVLMQQKDGLKN